MRDYEAAEQLLLTEVPLDFLRTTLGDVERNLLACYDQLGRGADAARAAERLSWTAGSNEDVKRLSFRLGNCWNSNQQRRDAHGEKKVTEFAQREGSHRLRYGILFLEFLNGTLCSLNHFH